MLNQQVDWVAWTSIQFYGACDALMMRARPLEFRSSYCVYINSMHVLGEVISVITQWKRYSALMMAVSEGKTEVVLLLLKAGANTDLQDEVNARASLH